MESGIVLADLLRLVPSLRLISRLALVLALASARLEAAPPTVTIDLPAGPPGPAIPADFAGLSFEMRQLQPDAPGRWFFSPSNRPLLSLLRSLGVRNIRLGGNTTDTPGMPVPSEADLDAYFAFARAAGARTLFTLRLRKGDPSAAARIAHYVMSRYAPLVECFAVGNEPDVYDHTYPDYLADFRRYVAEITAPGMAPDAVFCAPSTTPDRADWARQIAYDVGPLGRIRLITQHEYPGGNGRKVTDPAAARAEMLSPEWVRAYGQIADGFAPAAKAAGLPFRIEETNSFYNGGAKDVSDTLAAGIWALDYMYSWAEYGAVGVNFHTGEYVAAADTLTPCWYAAFRSSGGGYEVHPVGYALKAFSLAGEGRLSPARILANPARLNLTVHAVRRGDRLAVTVLNKELVRAAQISLRPGSMQAADYLTLSAPGGAAAKRGLILGGAGIGPDGSWAGTWTPLSIDSSGVCSIELPPCSAAIVEFHASRLSPRGPGSTDRASIGPAAAAEAVAGNGGKCQSVQPCFGGKQAELQ